MQKATPPAKTRGKAAAKADAPTRVRMNPEARREALLELSKRMFGETPYDQLSMEDVAAEAQISKGLLYHYFPNKRELYVETIRGAAGELELATRPDVTLPPVERLHESLKAYLNYVKNNASTYRRIMDSGVGFDEEVKGIVDDVRQIVVRRVIDGLGIATPAPLLKVALRGWVGFIEASSIAWIDETGCSEDELLKLLMLNLATAISATGAVVIDEHVAALLDLLGE